MVLRGGSDSHNPWGRPSFQVLMPCIFAVLVTEVSRLQDWTFQELCRGLYKFTSFQGSVLFLGLGAVGRWGS